VSFDLSGACALVTGCRRGMGLAIAEALAVAGADIVGASLSLELDGSEAQDRVQSHGRTFTAYRADLASETGAATLAAAVLGDGHRIDILVNHAGVIARIPALEHDDETWRHVLQTNLTSAFVLARELGRPMVERGRGKIIFTASLLSFQGGVNTASYTAAKSGTAGLVRALANEWAPYGVNVNAIVPGYVVTDQTQALRDDPARAQAILDRIPAGRWGKPTDIAGAAVFLASSASDYVHGALLPVDGGWLAR
jgi:2-deoxy-D-gluconate 3-dehydrogenase